MSLFQPKQQEQVMSFTPVKNKQFGSEISESSTDSQSILNKINAETKRLNPNHKKTGGSIKVKLASATPQWNNKAEVELDCPNPNEVVANMLKSIVDKFPPTAMSIEAINPGCPPTAAFKAAGPITQQPQHSYEKIVRVNEGLRVNRMQAVPVDSPIVVGKFYDREVPVIMSQTVVPELEESNDILEVEVHKYVPYLVPVDVYVPLPVSIPITPKGEVQSTEIPYDNIDPTVLERTMMEMNPHLVDLEKYNAQQEEVFQQLIEQSKNQAESYGLEPPQPIYNHLVHDDTDIINQLDNNSHNYNNNITATNSVCTSPRKPNMRYTYATPPDCLPGYQVKEGPYAHMEGFNFQKHNIMGADAITT